MMIKKVVGIKEHKQKKGRLTTEESARLAARRFLDPKYDTEKEPKSLASGKTSESGDFINKEDDKDEK